MQVKPEIVVLVAITLWLIGLTGFFYWFYQGINKLYKKTKIKDLVKAIDEIVKTEKENSKKIKELGLDLKKFQKNSKVHIQKVGLVRFNPFEETGGDHSFSLSLMDADDNGVVITGLHTRERTRLYLKSIKQGKSEYDLSKEEKESVEKAKKER